jgi:endo-1,4-beta-xylanase
VAAAPDGGPRGDPHIFFQIRGGLNSKGKSMTIRGRCARGGAVAVAVGALLAACAAPAAAGGGAGGGPAGGAAGGPRLGAGGGWGQVLPGAAPQAAAAAAAVHPHPAEVLLWPDGAPGSQGQTAPEVVAWRTETDTITGESFSFPTVTNIHAPSLTPYLPAKGKATGAAVIVAPGGGHMFHTINHEGYDVAQYLADRGVAAFVLKYRLARASTYPRNTYTIERDARADGQRAIRLVRARAAEWGVDPGRIGMMGFSAGGEVATQVALSPSAGQADAADPVDRESCAMNFQALIYPGMTRQMNPTKEWPPVFLACSFDDRGDIAGAAMGPNAATRPAAQGLAEVYLRYKAANVPAELHIYSTGGHGFGVRQRNISESQWADQFLGWLNDRGMLAPAKPQPRP